LAEPPAQGFSIILWIALPLGLLIGGYLFVQYMRKLRHALPTNGAHSATRDGLKGHHPQSDDDYLRQIEQEVAE
jgi:cytochrome c-type biogenesis protein CcmH/NrfF